MEEWPAFFNLIAIDGFAVLIVQALNL